MTSKKQQIYGNQYFGNKHASNHISSLRGSTHAPQTLRNWLSSLEAQPEICTVELGGAKYQCKYARHERCSHGEWPRWLTAGEWFVYDDERCSHANPMQISTESMDYEHWGNMQSYMLMYTKALEVATT